MLEPVELNFSSLDPKIDVNALGQAIDSTWGRTSTPKSACYSVKFTIVGGVLQASFAAIVNFATERDMIMMKRQYADEAKSVVDDAVSQVKKAYKDACGKALKTKLLGNSDSVEIISNSFSNPKRTAYYRSKVTFEMTG